jgi:hypothetical protein
MPDPVVMLIIVALAVTTLSVILARLIPDEYDRLNAEPVRVRTRKRA